MLFQNSQIFSCYVLALGGSYSPDKAQFLLLRNQIHFQSSNCMMKAFILSAVVGQRDPRFQPSSCLSCGLEHHWDHGTTLNKVNSSLCLPEIRFSSVIQPQEPGTAVIPRNVISDIIHKVILWGNNPFLGVMVSACLCVC